jgi:hypothetical protein
MITQGLLPFHYQNDPTAPQLTSFSGLPLYIDLAIASGLCTEIASQLQTKAQGWTDLQIILSLLMLNISGGDCVEDITRLEQDRGLSTLLLRIETHGMKRKERREYERRWRKEKNRALPSTSAIYRYLEQFHHPEEEKKRVIGEAFIPEANESLKKLLEIQRVLIDFAQKRNPVKTATLDQDATLAATHKQTALYCYKNYKAYQPFNTYWFEQELLLNSEFRDGNVPAGFEQLRILQESLNQLPVGVEKVFLRSDTAGYQQELLEYCAEGENERFGVIEFAIGVKVTPSFKQAVLEVRPEAWQPIYREETNGEKIETDQEWAEVCFVPAFAAKSKKQAEYRYLAIRERMSVQPELPGMELPVQLELPFQTMTVDQQTYKLFGVVTNRKIPGSDLINWHRKRCGQSEKVHSVEKSELAGGQFPSQKFGANAAWWQIMVMAFNLNQLMKRLVFPEALKTKAMKALRFHIIGVAGKVISHARGLFIRLSGSEAEVNLFIHIRQRIEELVKPPSLLSSA